MRILVAEPRSASLEMAVNRMNRIIPQAHILSTQTIDGLSDLVGEYDIHCLVSCEEALAEIKSLRAIGYPVKCIVFIERPDNEKLNQCIAAGCDMVMTHLAELDEWKAGLWQVISGQPYYDHRFVMGRKPNATPANETPSMPEIVEALTLMETIVLRNSLDDETVKDVAKQLDISVATVKSHRNKILMKMGFPNMRKLGQWWRKQGYGLP